MKYLDNFYSLSQSLDNFSLHDFSPFPVFDFSVAGNLPVINQLLGHTSTFRDSCRFQQFYQFDVFFL